MRASLLLWFGFEITLSACGSTSSGAGVDSGSSSSGSAIDGATTTETKDATTSSSNPTTGSGSASTHGGSSPADATTANDVDGGPSTTRSDTDAADAAVENSSDAAPAPVRPSAACTQDAGSLPNESISITYDGGARTFLLHVPTSAATAPRPLVLSLHGYYLNGQSQELTTGMNALADSEGFVVAYPDGLGNPRNWNAGACCSSAADGDRDDKGFLGAVIDDIAAHECIDLARVYVEGFSNGGMMTVRLACEMADRFAAAATVSGSAVIPLDTCHPSRPIPFMHIHGNHDPLVPYNGGDGGLPLPGRPTPVFPPVAQEVATLRNDDGCPPTSDVYFDQGNANCDHWGPCGTESEVIFCTIDGGTHEWPGPAGSGRILNETSPLDATSQIWSFMKRHALR